MARCPKTSRNRGESRQLGKLAYLVNRRVEFRQTYAKVSLSKGGAKRENRFPYKRNSFVQNKLQKQAQASPEIRT